ncbi:MAG: hypothetical protein RL764_537 [Pseudomonadota bacterium]|jgi:hypothetical protein
MADQNNSNEDQTDELKAAIARLSSKFGQAAVLKAVEGTKRRKMGRPSEQDWKELHQSMLADARLYLRGGDPLAEKSNYAIAKELSERKPGHSQDSTVRRLLRKLSGKRLKYVRINALLIAAAEHPLSVYLNLLSELRNLDPQSTIWQRYEAATEEVLAAYKDVFGVAPPVDASLDTVMTALSEYSVPQGLNLQIWPDRHPTPAADGAGGDESLEE